MEDMGFSPSNAEEHALLRPVLSLAHGYTHRGIMRSGKPRPCAIRDYPNSLLLGKNNQVDSDSSSFLLNDQKSPRLAREFLTNHGHKKEKKVVRDFPDFISKRVERVMECEDSQLEESIHNGVILNEKKKRKAIVLSIQENKDNVSDKENEDILLLSKENDAIEVSQSDIALRQYEEEKVVPFEDDEEPQIVGKTEIEPKEKKTIRDFPTVFKAKKEKKTTRDFPDSFKKEVDNSEHSEDDTLHQGKNDQEFLSSDKETYAILVYQKDAEDIVDVGSDKTQIQEGGKIEQKKERKTMRDFPDSISKGSIDITKGENEGKEGKKEKKAVRDFPCHLQLDVPKDKKERNIIQDFPDTNSTNMGVESSEGPESQIDVAEKSNSQVSYQRKKGKKIASLDKVIGKSESCIPLEEVEQEKIEDDVDEIMVAEKYEIDLRKEIETVSTFQRIKKTERKCAIRDLPDVSKPPSVFEKENLTKICDKNQGEASPSHGEAQPIDAEVPRTKEKKSVDSRKADDTEKKNRPLKEPDFVNGIRKVSYPRSDDKPLDEAEAKIKTRSDQEHATPMSVKRKNKTLTLSDSGKKVRQSSGKTGKPGLDADLGNPRKSLIETLRLFDSVRRKVVQDEEKSVKGKGGRADLQTLALVKDHGYVHTEKIIGPFPGLTVGDIFCLRTECSFARVHGPVQGGIDYLTAKDSAWDTPIAIGIVSNVGQDGEDSGEELIYGGQGGRSADNKQIADQKMDRGNLAMDGSRKYKVPVRVIRGIKDANSPSGKVFVYDGLYSVVETFIRKGSSGFNEFQFRLQRMHDQTELGSDLFKLARELKNQPPTSRANLALQDLSKGKEEQSICVENTIDDEKAPLDFEYVTKIRYPDGIEKIYPAGGCDCKGACMPSSKCSCFLRNGNELPYLSMGTLVREKDYIFECGNQCSCSTNCRNKVSPKIRLEVFKTRDRGWGVRSLEMIAAGSFICEYTGKMVLGEKMIKTVGNKEYVLDLRRISGKAPHWGNVPSIFPNRSPSDIMPDVGNLEVIIDANHCGNVSRFINHSCSPNLFIQKVLSHNQDAKLPLIKLFAMDNIPPLRELTFDYGCPTNDEDTIACLCGSVDCRGRL